jgi:uncharacterized phage-like protein YoqJ
MKIGFTGHRPPKIFYKHLKAYTEELYALLYNFIESYASNNKNVFNEHNTYNTGGALGFDSIIAQYILNTQNTLNLYLPFKSMGSNWFDDKDKQRLEQHKSLASKVFYTTESEVYSSKLYTERDKAIVDNSDVIIALWDGSRSGTKICTGYAKKQGKEVINLWNEWVKFYDNYR